MYTVTIEIESKRIHIEIYMVSDYGDHEDEDDDEDDHEEDDADHDDDAAAMIWTGFWHSNGKENTFIHTTSHYPFPGSPVGNVPVQYKTSWLSGFKRSSFNMFFF